MRIRHSLSCLLTGLTLIWCANPGPLAQADTPGSTVAPYVDSQTFVIARLDVQQLPLTELQQRGVDFLKRLIDDPHVHQSVGAAAKQLVTLHDMFLQAGGSEVYVIASMSDVPYQPPFFVVTSSAPDNLPVLQTMIGNLIREASPKMEVRKAADNSLLVGTASTLDRVQALKTEPRPEVTAAWNAATKAPLQLIVAPGRDQHRVLEETFPQFPPPWQQLTGQALSDGIQWGVLTIEASPTLKAHLVVESKSEAAAQQLAKLVTSSLGQLAQLPDVQKILPTANQLLALIEPKLEGKQVSITLTEDEKTIDAVMKPLVDAMTAARRNAQRMQSVNNLKQLGLAMHNYHEKNGRFPPAASYDHSGKPLLSWRVHILPFIEQKALYAEFKLDEPWDSEHNKKLAEVAVKVYEDPTLSLKRGMTTYMVPVGEGTVFGGKESLRLRDIVDGSSNTLMIVNATADNAVPWTKPEDLQVTKANPKTGLFSPQRKIMQTTFCDGSVRTLTNAIDDETLWLLLDATDRTPIEHDKIK